MAIMIRNNKEIQGVNIGDNQYKISQFADDTTCYVKGQSSLSAALATLQLFSKHSGLYINLDKSAILPVGRIPPDPPPNSGIEVAEKVKILGIWHANNRTEQDHYDWNFRPILERMRTCCSTWNNRRLSLKGKVTVFNSLVFSLLQYVNANTYTPNQVLTEVKQMAGNFIWGGKRNKVAHSTIIQTVKDGGLKVADMLARTQVNHLTWIRRIINNQNSTAASMVEHIFKGGKASIQIATKQQPPTGAASISPFYAEVLKTWALFHIKAPTNEEEVCREVIWNNSFTSSPRQVLSMQTWEKWVSAGIIIVNDLCHPSGKQALGTNGANGQVWNQYKFPRGPHHKEEHTPSMERNVIEQLLPRSGHQTHDDY